MFILYALVIGLVLGVVLGGRLAGLADLQFRWGGAMFLGLLIQVLLFSTPLADQVGAAGPPIYVGSTALVLVALLRNWRITGVPVIGVGAISNLSAIVANGGYMPADPGALAAIGGNIPTSYSNSTVVAHPALQPLTDIFVLPRWLPFANVFSIGDVLIALGVCLVIVAAMRRDRDGPAVDSAPSIGAREP
jgi:Family of unknown function (DUF5317)